MSAIWGAIDLRKRKLKKNIKASMEKPYESCVLDTRQDIFQHHIFMGCGKQIITKENETEILPYADQEKKLYITADCYLDNREELLHRLKLQEKVADSQIILEYYRRWGTSRFQEFSGIFAFVIYDADKNQAICAADAVSARCLYYYYEEGVLYFSTLLKPIVNSCGLGQRINERWIVDFMALDNLMMATEASETIYQDIFKLEAAQFIVAADTGIEKHDYWKPAKKHKLYDDKSYQEEFVTLLTEITKEAINTTGEVGILLSGGLDSSVVAGFAAPALKKNNKILHAFTSIPVREYVSDKERIYNVNEQELVQITAGFWKNIACDFVDMEGKNPWNEMSKMLEIYEIPYKAVQNVCWIYECLKQSYSKGARLMLNGQYGNATVSYGNREAYYLTLLCYGKIPMLKKEIDSFASQCGIGRKAVWKRILKDYKDKVLDIIKKNKPNFENVLIKRKFLEEYHVEKRFQEADLCIEHRTLTTMVENDRYFYNKKAFAQIGEMETKMSLATGVIMRDPTRDKRLIHFCMNLPDNQFVSGIYDRRLVNEYSKDRIAPQILETAKRRKGLQSADTNYRISQCWEQVKQEMEALFESREGYHYIEKKQLERLMPESSAQLLETDSFTLTKLIYHCVLLKFLQNC